MRDMHTQIAIDTAIGNATLTADNTPVAIDLSGFKSAEIVIAVGAGGITFTGTNKIEFKLQHSEDGTTYTDVVDLDMIGLTVATGGIIKSLVTAQAAPAVFRFGYKGNRRWLKLLADFSGTHGVGTPIAAFVVKGTPRVVPQN